VERQDIAAGTCAVVLAVPGWPADAPPMDRVLSSAECLRDGHRRAT
jgi:hypothetical protein